MIKESITIRLFSTDISLSHMDRVYSVQHKKLAILLPFTLLEQINYP